MSNVQNIAANLLERADVKINGNRPWDLQVKNDKFYRRVLAGGSLALGESYMDGWWEVEVLDEFFSKVLGAGLDKKVRPSFALGIAFLQAKLLNPQRRSKAFEIGKRHYDIGNDLYEAMLGQSMTYTCGYWKNLEPNPENLNAAQEAKLDLVCKKISLKAGDKILDIGCGWGSFAKYAASNYDARVVGITVSKEQVELAKEKCAGLPIDIRLMDYRDVNEQFDHIISLGMFEHVGQRNYRTYMEVVRRSLKDGGLFLLHTIGGNTSVLNTDPWINKYIFPNSMLPSIAQIGKSIEGLFVMEDWHNFSAYYDYTLCVWMSNVNRAWPKLQAKYGERFYRMWRYYLMASAGSFRSRRNQLWQIILSKSGVPGGYQSIR